MPNLWSTLPQLLLSVWGLRQSNSLRWIHKRKVNGEVLTAKPQKHQLSLFEELFPEEINNRNFQEVGSRSKEKSVPRLRLPNVDEIDRLYQDGPTEGRTQHDGMSREAFMERDSLRQGNPAVLITRRASKSLAESDFRRIAPNGQHIHDWKGPGDILKGMSMNTIIGPLPDSSESFRLVTCQRFSH